jgi:hypothetical protein
MEDRVLRELDQRIQILRETAFVLKSIGVEKGIPAVERNASRILASVRMLEINVSDIMRA